MDTLKYYRDLLAKHGPTYQAVDAGSEYTHQKRLEILADIFPFLYDGVCCDGTVLDVGCGLGDFIHDGMIQKRWYRGIDRIQEMIQAAQNKYPGYNFEVGDIANPKPEWESDYVVASGLFQFSDWTAVDESIQTMWNLCRKGVAMNFLRDGKSEEFITSPLEILEDSIPIDCHFYTLRADYLPNDFTVYLYKEKPT